MENAELGYWTTYCFLFNSVIGSSLLALPQAFQRAGVLPCFAALLAAGLLSWFMARLILSVTEKLTKSKVPLLTELSESHQQWDLPEIVRELFGRE